MLTSIQGTTRIAFGAPLLQAYTYQIVVGLKITQPTLELDTNTVAVLHPLRQQGRFAKKINT